MKYQILDSHLSESEKKYYENLNPGWRINTTHCMLVTFDDSISTTYVIFEGPWTKPNMCRDCGTHYELSLGNRLLKIPHELL